MGKITIYTDGSALGNPGPGGYGTIICNDGIKTEYSGGYKHTSNNRMELLAVIIGLSHVSDPSEIEIILDSQYVINAFNKNWIRNWIANDWKLTSGGPVKNKDLWKKLLEVKEKHDVTFSWVKGHDGHEENERCDLLAKTAAGKPEDQLDKYIDLKNI